MKKKKDYSKEIDKKFYRGDQERPMAETVGELKKLLNELPDELPIDIYRQYLVVFNVKQDFGSKAFLGFEED